MNQLQLSPRVNSALTRKVIALHSHGYEFDFSLTADKKIRCAQDNRSFTPDQLCIKVVDLRYDELTGSYKYVHTVETCCGDKGLLIDSCICVNAFLEPKAWCINTDQSALISEMCF